MIGPRMVKLKDSSINTWWFIETRMLEASSSFLLVLYCLVEGEEDNAMEKNFEQRGQGSTLIKIKEEEEET